MNSIHTQGSTTLQSRPVDNNQVQTCVTASKNSVAILSLMHEQKLLSDLVWMDDQFIFNTGITLWLRGFTEYGVMHRLEVEEFLPILARTYSSRLGQYAYDSLSAFYSDAEASLQASRSVSRYFLASFDCLLISSQRLPEANLADIFGLENTSSDSNTPSELGKPELLEFGYMTTFGSK